MISLRDVVTGFCNRDPLAEVWRRNLRGGSAEITGVPPLRYIGNGRPLTDYLISGNAVQDGTPSADAPVDAVGSGVRTGNLFDKSTTQNGYYIDDADGRMKYQINYVDVLSASDYIDIENASDIFITDTSRSRWGAYYDSLKTYISGFNGYGSMTVPSTARYVRITVPNAELDNIMLNLGSTALPYEPYGYKLPLTVNGTEYPIYLGTVPTTRQIKKLVLTGEETWNRDEATGVFSTDIAKSLFANFQTGISSHWPFEQNRGVYSLLTEGHGCIRNAYNALWIRDNSFPSVAAFKSYLAAQYAAGTPATVWYVLAEPETAVVNEPLMKIGDYADTISFAQSQVTIPTVSGANVLDVPTTVPPSQITIKGGISSV